VENLDEFRSVGPERSVPRKKAKEPKGPLDESMVEDASCRHEQLSEEAERWLADP